MLANKWPNRAEMQAAPTPLPFQRLLLRRARASLASLPPLRKRALNKAYYMYRYIYVLIPAAACETARWIFFLTTNIYHIYHCPRTCCCVLLAENLQIRRDCVLDFFFFFFALLLQLQ